MTSVRLTDGRVLHLPGAPHVVDSHSRIQAPAEADLAALAPLIPADDLLLFTGRLVTGARKRRRQERYAEVNAAPRLWFDPGSIPQTPLSSKCSAGSENNQYLPMPCRALLNPRSQQVRRISALRDRFRATWQQGQCSGLPA